MTRAPEASALALSVIIPTFQEAESLPHLLPRLKAVLEQMGEPWEVIIVDDDSRDGAAEYVAGLGVDAIRLVCRREDRGLSAAVVEGFRRARGEILLCMDADLSHAPEKIPELVRALRAGADFVIGSRYVQGGTTAESWNLFRRANSLAATILARPFTRARDPMSGFFALRRARFEAARELNPVGYKVGLELIVKCDCRFIDEVPIHFSDRKYGSSKLSLQEQLRYLTHVRRLLFHKLRSRLRPPR